MLQSGSFGGHYERTSELNFQRIMKWPGTPVWHFVLRLPTSNQTHPFYVSALLALQVYKEQYQILKENSYI